MTAFRTFGITMKPVSRLDLRRWDNFRSIDYPVHLVEIVILTEDMESVIFIKFEKSRFRRTFYEREPPGNPLLGNFYNSYSLLQDVHSGQAKRIDFTVSSQLTDQVSGKWISGIKESAEFFPLTL